MAKPNNLGKWRNIDRRNVAEVKNSAIIQIGTLQELFGSSAPNLISGDMPNAVGLGSDGKLFVNVAAAGGITDVRINGASVVSGGVANATGIATNASVTSAIATETANRDTAIATAITPLNASITSLQSSVANIGDPSIYDLKQGQFGSTASTVVVTISNEKGTAVQATIPAATAVSAGAMSATQYGALTSLDTRVTNLEAGGGGGGTPAYPPIATDSQAGIVLSDPTTPGNISVDITGVMTVNGGALQSDMDTVQSDITTLTSDVTDLKDRADAMDSTATGLQDQIDVINAASVTGEIAAHNADATAHAALNIPRQASDIGAATPLYVNTAVSTHNADGNAHSNQFAPITTLIPSAATSTNQLADKDFVTDAVTNMASNYVTYTTTGDEQWPDLATLQAGPWFHRGSSYTPTNNDYAMVLTGLAPNTEQWRAQFDGTQWNLLYQINSNAFTAAQMDAIDSGITATLVAQIGTNATDITTNNTAIAELNQYKASAFGDPNGAIPAENAMALNGKADTAFATADHNHDASIVMTSGVLPVQYGGTNLSAQVAGNMTYSVNTTTNVQITPPQANILQCLTHNGTVATPPTWQNIVGVVGSNVVLKQPIDGNSNPVSNQTMVGKLIIADDTRTGQQASLQVGQLDRNNQIGYIVTNTLYAASLGTGIDEGIPLSISADTADIDIEAHGAATRITDSGYTLASFSSQSGVEIGAGIDFTVHNGIILSPDTSMYIQSNYNLVIKSADDGTVVIESLTNMSDHRIEGLANPVAAQDAANMQYTAMGNNLASGTSLNTVQTSGMYNVYSPGNAPSGANNYFCLLQVAAYSAGSSGPSGMQILYCTNGIYVRSWSNINQWGNWVGYAQVNA